MHHPPTADAELGAELAAVRPALGPRFAAALPGARAAVLTRLWRALAHEPLPWIVRREQVREGLVLHLADGRRLHGPRPDPYTTAAYVTVVHLSGAGHGRGVGYDDPARLMGDLAVPHGSGFAAELGHSAASLALSRAAQGTSVPHSMEWTSHATGSTAETAGPTPETARSTADTLGSTANTTDRTAHTAEPASDTTDRTAHTTDRTTHTAEPAVHDWEWEQRVVDGHPYHPNCRARPGFSVAEQLAYAPEHRPSSVRLGLLPVPAGECLVSGLWPSSLRDGERLVIPVHPWQAQHVLKRSSPEGLAAHPLMSLRTLALPDGQHVKTALSTRLTSSVRDISIGSISASAALSAFGEELAERTDGLLHVTRTLGAVTAHSPDLAAVLREPPAAYAGPGEHVVPVGALTTTRLTASPDWTARFAALALTVGLRLLEMGVALEAHGQNLLVVLSASGEPLRLVYRDLADIRVSPARLARHGLPVRDLPERILTDDVTALRRKLFGSLVAGALAGTAGGRDALRSVLGTAVREVPSTPDLGALRGEPLPVKALTLMRLSPGVAGDRWTLLPNPLVHSQG
ncbi:IucA/IucC family protein [Streptomyces sp. NPDC003247]|uniref:IucA/IucC family protein n=1 Tax=Streptomyces sp. NPDC003247 TaxID=3364677 RepID=UPI0036CAA40C